MAKDYIGRIGSGGAQVVTAPYPPAAKQGGGKVVRGGDLRDGRKDKPGKK